MDPIPTLDPEITRSDWDKDEKLKDVFNSILRTPTVRTAIAIWKEEHRCLHGGSNPTLIAGVDPIQGAALLNAFREGANAAIDSFIRMGRIVHKKPEQKNDPRFPGNFQLHPDAASNQPPK